MGLNIFAILLGLFGQGLILAGFLLFCDHTPENILWLDIIVASIVYWLLATTFGLKPINLEDRTQKQVGGLGIRWYSTLMYSLFSIGYMAICGLCAMDDGQHVAFKWQLILQMLFLFLFLIGMLSTGHATKKTEEIYHKEQNIMHGKEEIKYALNDLSYTADSNPGVPSQIRASLKQISEETRYLTPSSSARALELDNRIFDVANRLRAALTSPYELNSQQIEYMIDQLRRDFQQRKQFI